MPDIKAKSKLSTEAYKGVRDFYPEDMAVEKAIFDIWRTTTEKYGYEEYAASVLEPAELYRAKSGEEIVNEQTYTFTDRGDREVTLRPEMTPTVARMVAGRRRELGFPVRWYSIPNLFRYEQPQRGRLREHWQLNVDIFGIESLAAEFEIISMAYDITRKYGLEDKDFEIRINSRELMDFVMKEAMALDEETAKKMSKIVDQKDKVTSDVFKQKVSHLLGESFKQLHIELFEIKDFNEFALKVSKITGKEKEIPGMTKIMTVLNGLKKLGIDNTRFDPTLMRGFDYYTGIVFEVFDLHPKNRRSVFGGGRYDDLLSLFGNDKVTAVGFGAGDVVARDIMETYGTLEKITSEQSPADVSLVVMEGGTHEYAFKLAKILRQSDVRVFADFSNKKIGDKIALADKRHIPFVIVIGEEEVKSDQVVVKKLETKNEKLFSSSEFDEIGKYIKTEKN